MWGRILLVLVLTHAWAEKEGNEELPAHKRQSVQYSTLVGPSFVNTSLHAHAHALIGQTAYLTCVVRNLHNYTISWVRARDIHLLTTGETTYTSDNRFVAVNPGGGDQWMLKLHHAQPSDAGTYLCQVSVSPPMSTAVTLLVTEAVASVRPGTDVYLKAGSRVVLVCEVFGCPYPALPAWYKGHKLQDGTEIEEGRIQATPAPPSSTSTSPPSSTSPSLSEGGISPIGPVNSVPFKYPFVTHSEGDKRQKESSGGGSTSSSSAPTTTTSAPSTAPTAVGLPIATATLMRPKASASHSGVYTCTNTCTDPVNLTLHVLTGDEETAAMQHPSGSTSRLIARPDTTARVVHLLSLLMCTAASRFFFFFS